MLQGRYWIKTDKNFLKEFKKGVIKDMSKVSSNVDSQKTKYPLHGDDVEGVVLVLIAEYNVLRGEIDVYHHHQKEIMNFAFLVLTAMFGIVGAGLALKSEQLPSIAFIFLLFPFVYTLLSFLYSDRTIRIIRIADYLHNYLRRKIDEVTGEHVWQWEIYKKHTTIFSRRLALVLDKTRWLVFLLPSLLSICIFFFFVPCPKQLYQITLIIIDGITILMCFAVMFITEETTGIEDKQRVDLDAFTK